MEEINACVASPVLPAGSLAICHEADKTVILFLRRLGFHPQKVKSLVMIQIKARQFNFSVAGLVSLKGPLLFRLCLAREVRLGFGGCLHG